MGVLTFVNSQADLEALLGRDVGHLASADEGTVQVNGRWAGEEREGGGVLDGGLLGRNEREEVSGGRWSETRRCEKRTRRKAEGAADGTVT